ncbi:hypothetical protein Tco_0638674, partial [Tanacetum coccineum]
PEINFLIQTASIAASEATMYSAFVADIAVVLCLELFVTSSNLSMQRNVEYPRALLYGSIAPDMRTTTNVSF